MRYYDEQNKCLVYVQDQASRLFWDNHWSNHSQKLLYKNKIPLTHFVTRITRKFLAKKSKVLEGGAGLAQNSWYLNLAGYKPIAMDFAPKTVQFLRDNRPEVNPVLGDVTQLPFQNKSVDGYWSLGVIEHFYNGYSSILNEAYRVLNDGGYLFLAFPYMSPFRRIKAYFKQYPKWDASNEKINKFYQFALDHQKVIKDIEKSGFRLKVVRKMDGVKGFKDEIIVGQKELQRLYDSRITIMRIINTVVSLLLSVFSSHSILLVFKKDEKSCHF